VKKIAAIEDHGCRFYSGTDSLYVAQAFWPVWFYLVQGRNQMNILQDEFAIDELLSGLGGWLAAAQAGMPVPQMLREAGRSPRRGIRGGPCPGGLGVVGGFFGEESRVLPFKSR